MSELDFDELDKAVNSLMSDVSRSEPTKTDDVATVTINSTLTSPVAPAPVIVSPVSTAVPAQPAVTATVLRRTGSAASSVATKRSGRFMDVVHPSSDMTTASKSSRLPSRQGVTIQPNSSKANDVNEEPSTLSTSDDAQLSDTASTPSQAADQPLQSTSDDHISQTDWPDPLDTGDYSNKLNEASSSATEAQVTDQQPVVNDESDDDALFTFDEGDDQVSDEPQPQTSPFLAGARVEKRPLGGTTEPLAVEISEGEPDHAPVLGALATETLSMSDPDDQIPATPEPTQAQLPPELHRELMAIETDGDTTPVVNALSDTSESTAPTAPEQKASSSSSASQSATTDAAESPTPSTGPTSITQQYREEASTSDQSGGTIFDTDSYHQPLAHPVKKKSGWLLIVWVLLLLILGGGIAAALYFFGVI